MTQLMKWRNYDTILIIFPDWLGSVQIESPDRLKEEYSEQLERASAAI